MSTLYQSKSIVGINQNSSHDGQYLPHNHGFQKVGTLYPIGQVWECNREVVRLRGEVMKFGCKRFSFVQFSVDEMKSTCFKYRESTITQQPFYPEQSTASIVSDAKEFISSHSTDAPFFLYLSFLQAHDSLFCSEEFCGNSQRGEASTYNFISNKVLLAVLHNLAKCVYIRTI